MQTLKRSVLSKGLPKPRFLGITQSLGLAGALAGIAIYAINKGVIKFSPTRALVQYIVPKRPYGQGHVSAFIPKKAGSPMKSRLVYRQQDRIAHKAFPGAGGHKGHPHAGRHVPPHREGIVAGDGRLQGNTLPAEPGRRRAVQIGFGGMEMKLSPSRSRMSTPCRWARRWALGTARRISSSTSGTLLSIFI